tara:strand:+ start:120 stop:239 length:120 start_codon:yes stop_codon:yes gene_type:complete
MLELEGITQPFQILASTATGYDAELSHLKYQRDGFGAIA